MANTFQGNHSHVFLGAGHERNERRTWMVIALCTVMMIAEIAGGWIFGSIALIADGLHMSTHASALLLAALAYRYARTHAEDERFSFGTGKLGDLAGFTSAVVLVMIAILIGYEAVSRLMWPVRIDFNEAIPIAVLGLAVNVASVLLLSGGRHGHSHDHGHSHAAHAKDHAHAHDGAGAEHVRLPKSTSTHTVQRRAITTCAPPSFMSWRMRGFQCWSSSRCFLAASLAGRGWIRSLVLAVPSSSPPGLIVSFAIPAPSCST